MEPEVVEAARVLSRLGLVTAYGHVSVRSGEYATITPAADLATVTADHLVRVPLDARSLPPGAPAEVWAHLAVYRARPDVSAIARAQPPSAFAAAALAPAGPSAPIIEKLSLDDLRQQPKLDDRRGMGGVGRVPVLHGQGAWLGEYVPVHDSALLLRSAELARSAAEALGNADAVVLRGNGALTVGGSPGVAVARMWVLGVVCETFLAAPTGVALSAAEIASWRGVQDELLPRLWQHLRSRS